MRRHALAGSVALVLVLAAAVAHASPASSGETAARAGRPPAPATDRPIFFHGTFGNPRWGGSIDFVVSQDGRSVTSIAGIAPGVCDDKDFGQLLAGRDGATGPTFSVFRPARIGPNGSFAAAERHAGQRRPFKPAASATVTGTFNGDTLRGRLRASRTTSFDTCTANVSFNARRVQ